MSDTTTLDTLKQALAPKTGMRRMPLPLQSYEHPSKPLSSERLLNLMAESEPSNARTAAALVPTPGLIPFVGVVGGPEIVLGGGPVRVIESIPGTVYVVSGTRFYRLSAGPTFVVTDLGDIGVPDTDQIPDYALMYTVAIGRTAAVVCVPPRCYTCGHGPTDTLNQIGGDFPGAATVAYQDGYFVFCSYARYDTFFISAINDPLSFDALDFASSEGLVSALRRVISHGNRLWLMGEGSVEVWYNSGDQNFPFRRQSGGVMEYPVGTPRSVATADNSVFWLGRDGIVYRTKGYQAERVSTNGIEEAIFQHGIADVQSALGYAQTGHSFYVLNFSNVTVVYDCATGKWHNRASDFGGVSRWRVTDAVLGSGEPLAGDIQSGKLFLITPSADTEDGLQVLRQFVTPPLWGGTVRAFCSRLEVEMEVGTADSSGFLNVQWSDDGGWNWTESRAMSAGALGATRARVFTTRLGSFRQRVFRFGKTGGRPTIYAIDADIVAGVS